MSSGFSTCLVKLPVPASQMEWRSHERKYRRDYDASTFTKIEIPSWLDSRQKLHRPWKSKERLENEYHTLEFIARNTTIPVPHPIGLEYIDGCLALTTEWIDGVPFPDLAKEVRSESYLEDYVQENILPQLRSIRAHKSGAVTGVVLPPIRVFDYSPNVEWHPRISDEAAAYQFCHNDLAQHNFLCDEVTGKVKAVIDWEFAGFYPAPFEAPLWRVPYYETKYDQLEIRQLLALLGPSVEMIQPSNKSFELVMDPIVTKCTLPNSPKSRYGPVLEKEEARMPV